MEDKELGLLSLVLFIKSKFFLIFSGDIFLLDDPLSALDLEVASTLLEISIMKEMKDKTFLISTNNQNYLKYADRILFLDDGDLMFDGTLEDFKKSAEWGKVNFDEEVDANEKVKR